MEELDNLFQNNHFQNSDEELLELIMNKQILEFLCRENINDLNYLIEDKNITVKHFCNNLERKNKIYLNNLGFDISNKHELNIKNKIEKINKLKIEDDVGLYMIETYMLLCNIFSYLD
jgi:hypothetical protein